MTATVTLPEGTTKLYVEVGGAGATVNGPEGTVVGGFNGSGGLVDTPTGGGASDVRTVSCGSSCQTGGAAASLNSRLVVAGGGGAGLCGETVSAGGTAGDTSAAGPGNGGNGGGSATCGAAGGNGGFDNGAAGTGGTGTSTLVPAGGNGSFGQGGDAPDGNGGLTSSFGGDGGGGYYGGGAGGTGGFGGGGGAGSSYYPKDATNASMKEDTTGTPEVLITPVVTAPAVTGVSPSSGPLTGGTTATITGTGFTGATAVDFGTVPASSFTVNGDTSITATAPAAASVGPVDVTVTTRAGTSATSPGDQYSYIYPFTGFATPVANPPAPNMVHAGQAIPIQFQLGGNYGLNILASTTVQQVTCATGVPDNTATASDTAGASGLQYNATTGTYTYVWKTSKASKGTCQKFTLGLNDGTFYTAVFDYIN